MEVSSSSRSTRTPWCYNCVSSWYSTFFNITLLQFPSGGGPRVAFHTGVLLGSAALWLLAFPFTTGKSYSHHLLALSSLSVISGCHHQDCYRAASAALQREMTLERQAAALLFQLNSCSAGDSLKSPRAALTPEAPRLPKYYSVGKEEGKSKVPKATVKMSPMD